MVDCTCKSGVLYRALKNCQKLKIVTFMLSQRFCHSKFLTQLCTANETLKPILLTLSTGSSMKAWAWVSQAGAKQHTMVGLQKQPVGQSILDFYSLQLYIGETSHAPQMALRSASSDVTDQNTATFHL
jgi:hypothetical protein